MEMTATENKLLLKDFVSNVSNKDEAVLML